MVIRKRLPIKGKALVYITTTATDWIPVFGDAVVASIVMSKLAEAVEQFQVAVVGYVLMPSHLHLMLGFAHVELLSKFMQSFKILSSKTVRELVFPSILDRLWNNGRFSLWKPRFDDLITVSEEQFRIKLNYIHNNPVKAGLVSDPCDWFYSSASDWLKDEPGPVKVDKHFKWTE